jgi:oxygen-independent coproporphyrinogen-3 oxidase
VSNFGRSGCASRHNRGYWTGASYVGVGPSAHGFDGTERRWNAREYAEWLRLIDQGVDPIGGSEALTEENRMSEEVYLGLRTSHGLALHRDELATAGPWVQSGWGVLDAGRLRLTPMGWLRLDAIAASLTMIRSR